MARDCRKKTEHVQNNPTSGWSGTDDKTKGKPSKGRGKHDKGKGKGKPSEGKGKSKSKRKGLNNTARKERKDFTKWRGTMTNQKHKPVKNTQGGRTRLGITLTTGLTQTAGRVTGAQICEQCARQLPPTQPAQEQSNSTHGGSISVLGGLTMCELSVNDG